MHGITFFCACQLKPVICLCARDRASPRIPDSINFSPVLSHRIPDSIRQAPKIAFHLGVKWQNYPIEYQKHRFYGTAWNKKKLWNTLSIWFVREKSFFVPQFHSSTLFWHAQPEKNLVVRLEARDAKHVTQSLSGRKHSKIYGTCGTRPFSLYYYYCINNYIYINQ